MKQFYFLCFLFCFSTVFGQFNVFEVSRNGNINQIQVLYKNDSSIINKKNDAGYTPLILACYNGNEPIVSFLVDKVLSINENSSSGTALMAASFKGYSNIAALLIRHDADLNLADASGATALHYAVMFNHKDVVKVLIDAGANVNAKDGRGQTVLDYVKNTENKELIKILKQKHYENN